MNTTSLTSYTENDGSTHYLVTVDDGRPQEISYERVELIAEQRKAAGWEIWRERRDGAGKIFDALYILSDKTARS